MQNLAEPPSVQARHGGTVHAQYFTCGKPNCRCRNGERHGPYYCLFRRDGRGRLHKTYLRGAALKQARQAVAHRQKTRAALREIQADREAMMQQWRDALCQFKALGLNV